MPGEYGAIIASATEMPTYSNHASGRQRYKSLLTNDSIKHQDKNEKQRDRLRGWRGSCHPVTQLGRNPPLPGSLEVWESPAARNCETCQSEGAGEGRREMAKAVRL